MSGLCSSDVAFKIGRVIVERVACGASERDVRAGVRGRSD